MLCPRMPSSTYTSQACTLLQNLLLRDSARLRMLLINQLG